MNEPVLSSPFFVRRFWSLSVSFTLMVSMIFMIRFGISVMSENRKLFLHAASLRLGQTQQEVVSIMGTPDQLTTSAGFITYSYGKKQKNFNEMLNWIDSVNHSATNQKRYANWPIIIYFDLRTGKTVRLKKGALTIE